MVQKLLKLLLSLSLIMPLSAFALGLGDPHLHSALGERLNANIDLLSVNAAEAPTLSVSLASQETFDKVGLDRPAVLMFLKFDVVKDNSGKYSIRVTSREPIQEPFLDFLVEVNWKSGRILREYTLLLDPPDAGKQRKSAPPAVTPVSTIAESGEKAFPVSAAQEQQRATRQAEQEIAAAKGAAQTAAKGDDAAQGADATQAKADEAAAKDATTGRSAARGKATAPSRSRAAAAPLPAGGLTYGPIKARETLWRIAQRMRGNRNISVQQMMLALQKANPDAFINNNINLIKRGYVLRVDDPALLGELKQSDAIREVARQNSAWEDYKQSVAGRAKRRPAAASAKRSKATAATARKSEPKLKLVAPQGKVADKARPSGTSAKKPKEEMSEELMLALESAAAQRKENEALKERMGALQEQIKGMERIATIKNADLATMQQQLGEQGKQPESAAATAPAAQPAAKQEPAKPAATKQAPKPQAAKSAKPEQDKPAESKPKPRPKPVAPPAEEPSLMDEIFGFINEMLPQDLSNILPDDLAGILPAGMGDDPMMMGLVGGVFFFLLILLLLVIRKRRKGGFQESILNLKGGTSSMMNASEDLGSETSFLSDLAVSGMDSSTVQTDEGEVDPLTEAEVFIAYGRNQQAEEVLKSARAVSPERADIAAKLLEVYYNAKESGKFEELVEEAAATLQSDQALWDKVVAMGRELCPDNVLFSGTGAGIAAAAAPAAAATADMVMDIGLDLDEAPSAAPAQMDDELDIDLGLDFNDLDTADEGGEAESLSEEFGDLDLDMGLGDEGSDDGLDLDFGSLDLGESEADEEIGGDLDFDLDLGGVEEETSGETELDFDLDLGGVEEEGAGETELDLDMGGTEEVAGLGGDLDFDLDLGTGEEPAESSDELGFDLDLGGAEESDSDSDDFGSGLDLGGSEESGDELSFDSELGSVDEADAEVAGDLGLDLDFGTAEESADADMGFSLDSAAAEEPEESGGDDLDFGLDFGEEESSESLDAEIDFGLDLGAEGEGGDDLDFALNTLAEEDTAGSGDDLGLEFGADDFGLDDLSDSETALESASLDDGMDLDTALDELAGFGDLGDFGDIDGGDDEIATKLDLAQAYAEMGDSEGARTMLEEIVVAGNEEQKQQAQALIGRL